MSSYRVIRPCYVPIGEGVKYKVPGQVVTLSSKQAKILDGYIVPLNAPVSVRNPDTGIVVRNPDTPASSRPRKSSGVTMKQPVVEEVVEEVTQDVGDSQTDNE